MRRGSVFFSRLYSRDQKGWNTYDCKTFEIIILFCIVLLLFEVYKAQTRRKYFFFLFLGWTVLSVVLLPLYVSKTVVFWVFCSPVY
jgi:hypothetical protein